MENSMDRYLGQTLDDRYEILEVIGCGGMAVVYKALCHRLNRYVAVKILKDEFAGDSDFAEHFKAESQAVAMLSHPNIVSVYDYSKDSNCQYIVMELIEGITLKQYMQKKGKLSLKESLHFSTQVSRALEHAHSKGIVHRDIKPHNIMVLKDGSIKVADFGIAHLQNESSADKNETIGSIHYISPEQAKGAPVDARSDIYSLGVVMYEMLTGQLPYDGETAQAIAIQHINSILTPPSALNPEIPQALEEITINAMSSDINLRYQSASDILDALENFRKSQANGNIDLVSDPFDNSQINNYDDYSNQTLRPISNAGELSPKSYARRKVRSRKVSTFFGIALVTVFILAIVGFLWNYFIKDIFVSSERVTITNFIGEDSEDIINSVAFDMYNFEVEYTFNPNYPDGYIISQDPVADRSVIATSDGIDMQLTVSKGVLLNEIPDMVNHEYRDATIILEKLGFVVESSIIASDTITKDYVVNTEPTAGEELAAGSTIIINISGGPELKEYKMPDLNGKSESAAVSALEKLNLKVGSISQVNDDSAQKGTIFWQSIPAGENVTEQTVVYLKISLGPNPTPPPEETENPDEGTDPDPDPDPDPDQDPTQPVDPPPVTDTAETTELLLNDVSKLINSIVSSVNP